jgi:hypothetical protein
MRCPDEIAELIVPMLKYGLLKIRAAAWQGNAHLCAVESDHLHNLPELLADYTPDKLSCYWNAARPSYIEQIGLDQSIGWEELWQQLGEQVNRHHPITSHP